MVLDDLGAIIEYLFSTSLKRSFDESDFVFAIGGTKAYSEYVKFAYMKDALNSQYYKPSYSDMSLWIYTPEDTKLDNIKSDIDKFIAIMNEEFGKLNKTVQLTISAAMHRTGYNDSGSGGIKFSAEQLYEISGKPGKNEYYGRLSASVGKIQIPFAKIYVVNNETLIDDMNKIYSCELMPKLGDARICDATRNYISLDELIWEFTHSGTNYDYQITKLKAGITSPDTVLNPVFGVVPVGTNIIYDATGTSKLMQSGKNIPQSMIGYWNEKISGDVNHFRDSIYDVYKGVLLNSGYGTSDYYQEVNDALLESYYFGTKISSEIINERVKDMDLAFEHSMSNILTLDKPYTVWRIVKYIDPPRKGPKDTQFKPNIFNLEVGDILPCISYWSTTVENKRASEWVNSAPEFRGFVFVIRVTSSAGAIYLGDKSFYPNEEEVLLDRNGFIKIDKIESGYMIAQGCWKDGALYEKSVIYCTYIPNSVKIAEKITTIPTSLIGTTKRVLDVRAMQYNVCWQALVGQPDSSMHHCKGNDFDNDCADNIAHAIVDEAENYDFINLQEVKFKSSNYNVLMKYIVAQRADFLSEYHVATAVSEMDGVVTFYNSAWELLTSKGGTFSGTDKDRPFLIGTYRHKRTGLKAVVVNAHFPHEKKTEKIDGWLKEIDLFAGSPAKAIDIYIFSGDFNHDNPYEKFPKEWPLRNDPIVIKTCCSKDITEKYENTYDHIYTNMKTISYLAGKTYTEGGYNRMSDHLPVLGKFKYEYDEKVFTKGQIKLPIILGQQEGAVPFGKMWNYVNAGQSDSPRSSFLFGFYYVVFNVFAILIVIIIMLIFIVADDIFTCWYDNHLNEIKKLKTENTNYAKNDSM
jgi:endonuclease/exonuclease/phosphatase family metal-dependent hydrolase